MRRGKLLNKMFLNCFDYVHEGTRIICVSERLMHVHIFLLLLYSVSLESPK